MVPRPGTEKPTARARAAAAGVALLAGTLAWTAPSDAGGAEVRGGAYGQHVSVARPGAPPATSGPAPAVTTAPGGGTASDAAPSVTVEGDPAGAFGGAYLRTGPLTAASSADTGPGGSVRTSATAASVDALGGLLTAEGVSAACAADGTASAGAVSVTGGRLALSATETVDLPSEPAPGTTLTAATGAGERFTVLLNEQQVVDGILVVNAVRVALDGPTATGSIVVASASCGMSTAPDVDSTTPTTSPPAAAGTPETTAPTTVPPAVPGPSNADAGPAPTDGTSAPAETATAPSTETVTAAPAAPAESGAPPATDTGAPPAAEAPSPLLDTLVGVRAATSALQSVTVSAVTGSAFGYSVRVSILNSPVQERGPAPTVTLPATGSTEPVTNTVPSALVRIGPADLFMAGEITVRTQGTTGPEGSATSSTSVGRTTDPEPPGPVLFDRVASSCTATAAGVSGTATITGGKLETKYDVDTQDPTVVEDIPVNPAPNTTRTGTLDHIKDSYRAVFNEQVQNADGSLTVNAVHLYLLGPSGVGDIIVGQSRCGVTKAAVEPTTTTVPPAATAVTASTAAASRSATDTAVAGASLSRGAGDGNALALTGGSVPRLLPLVLIAAALAAARLRRLRDEGPPTGP